MGTSKIEWTESTWNPLVGCSKVSPGCKHCYAEVMARRLAAMGATGYRDAIGADGRWSGKVFWNSAAKVVEPLRVKRPRVWFVDSMSDLFHESVPDAWIDQVFAIMALAHQHRFLVLTKRAARMRRYFEGGARGRVLTQLREREATGVMLGWPLPNVGLGVSVEHQGYVERVWDLLQTPAALRFLSAEPLLGPLDIGDMVCATWRRGLTLGSYLDWVICGGESGPGARPAHPDWVRGLRDMCVAGDVPFFFKQWGAWLPLANVYAEREVPGEPGVIDGDWPLSAVEAYAHRMVCALELSGEMSYWQAPDGSWHTDHQPGSGAYYLARVGKREAGKELDGEYWLEGPGWWLYGDGEGDLRSRDVLDLIRADLAAGGGTLAQQAETRAQQGQQEQLAKLGGEEEETAARS